MRAGLWVLALAAGLNFVAAGCTFDDEEYKVGRHYLDEQDNWKLAADFFRKSLRNHPDRWKTHAALLEALGRGDDPAQLEAQLRETLAVFPDSARSTTLSNSAAQLIGEDRYNQIAGSLQLADLQRQISTKSDNPALLARGIIAACRAADASATLSLFDSFLRLKSAPAIPDSVRYELDYFIGPAQVERATLAIRLEQKPNDPKLLLSLARANLLSFDLEGAKSALQKAIAADAVTTGSPDVVATFKALFGEPPFAIQIRSNGWDGCASQEGRIVTIRDLGKRDDPDQYFFIGETPIMKAGQQNLRAIAMPRFSPDGAWIYFYGSNEKNWRPNSPGRFQLYRVKPVYGATPQKLTDDELIPADFFIEPSGSALIVRRDVGSVRKSGEVIRCNPVSKSVSPVVRIGEQIQSACFTSGGDSLLFISDRGLLKRSLTGGQVTSVLPWQGTSLPSISPDGKWLLLHSKVGDQLLVERSTGAIVYLGSCDFTGGRFTGSAKLLVTRKINGDLQAVEFDLNNRTVSSEHFLAPQGSNP